MAVFYWLSVIPFSQRALFDYLCANAWISNVLLNCLGQECQVSQVTIQSADFGIAIRKGCDAIEPSWLFCASVLAFPAPFKRKIPGVLIGVAVLLALNVVRIVSLYFIGVHLPGFFSTAHLEIWPVVFIVTAILLWLGWIRWAMRNNGSPAA